MRMRSVIVFIVAALGLTACTTRRAMNVEVTAAQFSVITDDQGRFERTNHYAPCVVAQGVPFTLDFADHASFDSPGTHRLEHYFDGVVTRLTVVVSNGTACFSGCADYQMHLGVTSSYYEDDEALYGQTLRLFSTHFCGTSTLGHEIRIHVGEDIDNEPSVCLIFRQSSAPISKFTGQILDDSQ